MEEFFIIVRRRGRKNVFVFFEDFSELIFCLVIDVEIVFEGSVESIFEMKSGFKFGFRGVKERLVFFVKVKGGDDEDDIFDSDSDGLILKEF